MSEQDSSHGIRIGAQVKDRIAEVSICPKLFVPEYSNGREVVSASWHRKIELPATFEADLVGSLLDREYSAHLLVTAPKDESENPQQRFHTSCARLRSQLPLASSHSSIERTLARASAIEQSAAP